MDLNDIRPGDFVRIGDTRIAWKPEFYFKWDSTGRIPIGYSEGRNTRPIDLTYSFMRNNGFINFDKDILVLYTCIGSTVIEVYAEIGAMSIELTIYRYVQDEDRFETMYSKEIKYIHELQHAFEDCGLKDKIVLD